MKKVITFSVFAAIIILSIVAKNTAEAQNFTGSGPHRHFTARPAFPMRGYVLTAHGWALRPIYHRPVVKRMHWRVRTGKGSGYRW